MCESGGLCVNTCASQVLKVRAQGTGGTTQGTRGSTQGTRGSTQGARGSTRVNPAIFL